VFTTCRIGEPWVTGSIASSIVWVRAGVQSVSARSDAPSPAMRAAFVSPQDPFGCIQA
jgi:hypothetical protein